MVVVEQTQMLIVRGNAFNLEEYEFEFEKINQKSRKCNYERGSVSILKMITLPARQFLFSTE